MERVPFKSLSWNINDSINKLNDIFYKRRFFVRQSLLLNYTLIYYSGNKCQNLSRI